jgi:hypothetical protein
MDDVKCRTNYTDNTRYLSPSPDTTKELKKIAISSEMRWVKREYVRWDECEESAIEG